MSEDIVPNKCGKHLVLGFACGRPDCHQGPCGEPWKTSKGDEGKMRRANYLPAPHFFALNQACVTINTALGSFGCYLVGSSLETKDYRDVDVRFIMSDTAFDRLFRDRNGENETSRGGWLNPLWSLMCVAFSRWLSEQSGLPIDFQIQRQTQANEKHGGGRAALGIFLDYPGERPSEVGPKAEART